jgi:hypothetical protein
MERLAARREEMVNVRETLGEQLAGERTEELKTEGIEAAVELGGLLGRLDATAELAGRRALSKTRAVLERATEDGSLEEAREAVETLEAESLRGWADRTEREYLLEEIAERAGLRIKEGTKQVHADGRLTASVEIPDRGTMPLAISGGPSAGNPAGASVLWRAVESDIKGDGTQDGACRAQREAVEFVAERYGEEMIVEADDGAQEPTTQPHQVSRGAR